MKRNISLLLIALVCLAGCAIDDMSEPAASGGEADGITFVVNLPKQSSGPTAYADDDLPAAESQVDEVDVFAFTKEDDTYYYVENQRGTNISNAEKLKKTFRAKFAKLKTGQSYCFVVLANARTLVDTKAYNTDNTMEDVMTRFEVDHTDPWNITERSIPMWGMSDDVEMAEENRTIDNLWLLRMLAKVDVTVGEKADKVFTLESVRLYNYRTKGYLVPDTNNLAEGSLKQVVKPTVLGNRVTDPNKPWVYEGLTGNKCVNTIYAFETDSAVIEKRLDEANSHCIVIGGTYGNDDAPTYYKVYFKRVSGSETTYPSLLRNHRYEISIAEVKSSGYETPYDAVIAQDVDFNNAIVVEWNDGGMTSVDLDGIDGDTNQVNIGGDTVDDWEDKGNDAGIGGTGDDSKQIGIGGSPVDNWEEKGNGVGLDPESK